MIYTTLNKIKSKNPCKSGWDKLLTHLNKTKADDEPLSFKTILESNGVNDAIWALQTIEGHDKEIRLFAVSCARRVQHLMKDERIIKALDVAEKYANGECTKAELDDAAAGAAWAAVGHAARAGAWCAAGAAAWCAAGGATAGATAGAADAAGAAAWDTAGNAARAAAWDTAGNAARNAEISWQTEEFKRVFCSE